MSAIPIIATQSNNLPQFTHRQKVTMELSRFLRKNGFLDFVYDSSKITSGSTVTIFSKTIDTREVKGEIFKKDDGIDAFRLTIDEKNTQTQKEFENDVADIYVGLKYRGTRQIISRTQIQKMPGGQWGARIIIDLDKSGSYELVIGTPAQPPAPLTASNP